MKYLTIAFTLLLFGQSSAQVMVVHRSGSADTSIRVADIAKLLFSPVPTMVVSISGSTATPTLPIANITKLTFDSIPKPSDAVSRPVVYGSRGITPIVMTIFQNQLSTRIEYTVDKPALVRIRVFDMQGKVVRIISDGEMNVGHYSITWNSCDDGGQKVSDAPYIVNVEIDGKAISRNLFVVN
jgi:hypothetical protein